MLNRGFVGGKITKFSRKRHLKEVYQLGEDNRVFDLPIFSFIKENAEGVTPGHNNPVVITMILSNANLHRTLVNQGSSADILFKPAFDKLRLEEKDLKAYPDNLKEELCPQPEGKIEKVQIGDQTEKTMSIGANLEKGLKAQLVNLL